jgi:hypothetical protein
MNRKKQSVLLLSYGTDDPEIQFQQRQEIFHIFKTLTPALGHKQSPTVLVRGFLPGGGLQRQRREVAEVKE